MPTVITISDGNLAQQNTTPDMLCGLLYFKNTEETVTADMLPLFQNPTLITSWKQVKQMTSALTEAHMDFWEEFYFIVETFFTTNPNGQLWCFQNVSIEEAPTFPTLFDTMFTELLNASDGQIRNVGLVTSGYPYSPSNVTTVNNFAQNYTDTEFCPFSVWYHVSDIGELENVRGYGAGRVALCIATIDIKKSGLGYILGMRSKRKVHESVGWIETSRLPIAVDADITITNEDSDSVRYLSNTELDNIHNLGYTYIRYYRNYSGYYVNNAPMCTAVTSDFAYSQYRAVIDKAYRLLREYILPAENAPVYKTQDGKLSEGTLAYFRSRAEKALLQMKTALEISDFRQVNVSFDGPTETITINCEILRVNTAQYINVNLGYTL